MVSEMKCPTFHKVAKTLVPEGLRSTKGGLSSLTVADSMDHVGVRQLSGRGVLWRNYRANTVGH